MSLIAKLLGGPIERRAVDASALSWAVLDGLPSSKAGVSVNIDTALRTATVLACVRVLAEGIAQLPLRLMRDTGDRKKPAVDHALYNVLARRPNEWMTSFQFRETLMYHAVLTQGGFAWINRSEDGDILELLPLLPGRVTVTQAPDWRVTYTVSPPGMSAVTLPSSEIFHVSAPSWNTYQGLEIVRLARDAIGLSIALEESHSKLHANGARPGGILTTDQQLKKDAKDNLRSEWLSKFGGSGNVMGTAVLDGGMKWQAIAMSGVDAQHLETRKHEIEEICRVFMVHPQMIFHTDKTSTHASAEQFSLDFVKYGLGPWVTRWEQSIDRDLLSSEEIRRGYYSHLEVKGLLRGDHRALAEFYKASLGTASSPGWNSPNDIRRLEDQDPSDQGGADKIITLDDFSGKAAPPGDGETVPPADSPGKPVPAKPTAAA